MMGLSSAIIIVFLGLEACAGNMKPNRGFCPMYFLVATGKFSFTLREEIFCTEQFLSFVWFQAIQMDIPMGAMMALFSKFQN